MSTALLWLLVSMVTFSITEILAKMYAANANIKYILWSILLAGLNSVAFIKALQAYNSLSIIGTLWNIAYVTLTIGLAVVMYHEPLTAKQIAGFILSCVGVVLMSV